MTQARVSAATANGSVVSPVDKHADRVLDRRIARAIAGSFVVSVVTVPFGYLTSFILARVSPEAVGTYSVLGIYLGIVSGILYFGGGTVTIRFMSELRAERRSSFFVSYFLLTLGILAFVTATLVAAPEAWKLVFGSSAGTDLYLILLVLTPLPLFHVSALAALKGLMRVTLAQTLTRAVTVAVGLVYAYVFLFHAEFFRQHPAQVIFVSYFLVLVVVSAALWHKLRKEIGPFLRKWRWCLPPGFWRYAWGLQFASMLGLLHMKIDQIMVLRELDLSQLGIFFVALQIAEPAPLLLMFLVEGVLPGMTNLLAAGRLERIEQLYHKVARYMVLLSTGMTFLLLAFAQPILAFFGEQYLFAYSALILLLIFSNLDSLGFLNQTLMISLNRPKYWNITQLIRIGTFVALFPSLTDQMGLLGAAVARGIAWFLAGAFGYYVILRKLPARPRVPMQFFLSAGLSVALGVLCYSTLASGDGWTWRILLFAVSSVIFLVIGGYGLDDLRQVPSLLSRRAGGSSQTDETGGEK